MKKNNIKFRAILFLLLISKISSAQYIEDYPVNKGNGDLMISTNNWPEAVRIFNDLYQEDTTNLEFKYKLGKAYTFADIDKKKSLHYLLAIEKEENKEDDFYKTLAMAYFYNYKFDKAKEIYKTLAGLASTDEEKKKMNEWVMQCDHSKKMMISPVAVEFENLGSNVNSDAPDFLPITAPDESRIYFTTRRKGVVGNLNSYVGYKTADIFTAKHSRNRYSKSRSVGNPNTYGNEFTAGRSDNGNYFTYVVNSEDYFNDIFIAEMGRRSLMPPKVLASEEVNGKNDELGATLSNNGEILYFSSNRDGGYGGFDLWFVQRLPTGEWGEVKNLGASINTDKDEMYPMLADDEQLLYFSSNGYEGMGGMDIFVSRTSNQPHLWQAPKNLGYPINSPMDDLNISFAENRRYAYMAKRFDDTEGDLDIYRLTFLTTTDQSTAVIGKVVDSDSIPIVNRVVEIEIFNGQTGELEGLYLSNSKNGKFTAALTPGSYDIEVKGQEGYKDYNESIIILGKNNFVPFRIFNIMLEPQ